jgi:hypothetical protein
MSTMWFKIAWPQQLKTMPRELYKNTIELNLTDFSRRELLMRRKKLRLKERKKERDEEEKKNSENLRKKLKKLS